MTGREGAWGARMKLVGVGIKRKQKRDGPSSAARASLTLKVDLGPFQGLNKG